LAELREARRRSQAELAKKLGVQQSTVSRIERRTEMYVSTLTGIAEEMGGTLEIIARHLPIFRRQVHGAFPKSVVGRQELTSFTLGFPLVGLRASQVVGKTAAAGSPPITVDIDLKRNPASWLRIRASVLLESGRNPHSHGI
jgi:DNA-binding XRE family transcriptional regulator